MTEQSFDYDVFLSHNSRDKQAVQWLAERLEDEAGLAVFLDVWNLVPGEPWQEDLERALAGSATIAVFLGPAGISSWHNKEMRDALNRQASDPGRRVIPVILPGADLEQVEVPSFLSQLTWVDFQSGLENEEALHRLIAGITGVPPGRGPGKTRPRRPAPQPQPQKTAEREKSSPNSGGIQIGSISGISGGEINIAGRDIRKTTRTAGTASGEAAAQIGVAEAFAGIYRAIAARPVATDVDREEIVAQVQRIEMEIQKVGEMRASALDRWLEYLAEIAPDIHDQLVGVLVRPLKGVDPGVTEIGEKARRG
jgi:hypothetical protein